VVVEGFAVVATVAKLMDQFSAVQSPLLLTDHRLLRYHHPHYQSSAPYVLASEHA
jgi:hypothetical protein